MARLRKVVCLVLAFYAVAPVIARATSYPPIVVGYFDAYYRSTPDPAPSDWEVSAGEWNWRDASDGLATALQPQIKANPWLHLFYGVDRYTIHDRTSLENSFNEKIEKTGDFDFVLKSIVSGSQGSYSLRVLLVEGTTRDVLGECTETFADRKDAQSAGERAARDLLSIPSLIEKYWLEHRRKSHQSAISPEVTVTPPTSMLPDTSAPVVVSAVDCDGVPMVGARITLYCTCGKLSSTSVVLGSGGTAKVRYHTGTLASLGSVTGQLDYTRPNGLHEKIMATKPIKIGSRNEVWWELHVHFKQTDTGTRDDTSTIDGGSVRETAFDVATKQGDLTIWYRERPSFESSSGTVRSGPPVAIVGGGTYVRHLHEAATRTSARGVSGSIDLVDEIGGLNVTRSVGIYASVRGGRIAVIGPSLPFDTWMETFNQSYDSWDTTIASAVDTHRPNDRIFFDLNASQALGSGDLRGQIIRIRSHKVTNSVVNGVSHVIVTDVEGKVRTLSRVR